MGYDLSTGRYNHSFERLKPFKVEKNLLTFATARTGKGATQIIPWLLENTNTNALVIDPKGEALEATLEKRSSVRKVYALDPFNTTNNTDHVKAFINVLDFINPLANSAFREINALADGLIMRHDAKGAHWDGGGVEILAGFIAHVLSWPDYEGRRSLVTVRRLLTLQIEEFNNVIDEMAANHNCGNLPAVAAAKINNSGNEANHFISVAVSNTKWIDDPDISQLMASSSFDLREIKTKRIDVFLILPVEALGDYGRFLRLFVRIALYYMQVKITTKKGKQKLKGKEVYFILDEAFSLGHIAEIESSMSAMPGFNLRMWTFWQDLNQIIKRYDEKGAGTFIANADAIYFFGVNDQHTADYVSKATGLIEEHEIGVRPPNAPQIEIALFADKPDPIEQQNKQAKYQDEMNQYQHARNVIGRPRITPDMVQRLTARNPNRGIAETALVLREGVCYTQNLRAYFEPEPVPKPQSAPQNEITFLDYFRNFDSELIAFWLIIIAGVTVWGYFGFHLWVNDLYFEALFLGGFLGGVTMFLLQQTYAFICHLFFE